MERGAELSESRMSYQHGAVYYMDNLYLQKQWSSWASGEVLIKKKKRIKKQVNQIGWQNHDHL